MSGCNPILYRLPASAVEARSTLRLRQGVCVRHSEALDLVATAASGRLLNRNPNPNPNPNPFTNPITKP